MACSHAHTFQLAKVQSQFTHYYRIVPFDNFCNSDCIKAGLIAIIVDIILWVDVIHRTGEIATSRGTSVVLYRYIIRSIRSLYSVSYDVICSRNKMHDHDCKGTDKRCGCTTILGSQGTKDTNIIPFS